DPRGRVVKIENGCDFDDFAGLEYRRGDRFRLTHAGSFFGKRDPRPFLQALADSDLEDVVVRFVGDFRTSDRDFAESLGLGDRVGSRGAPRRRGGAARGAARPARALVGRPAGRDSAVAGVAREALAHGARGGAGRPAAITCMRLQRATEFLFLATMFCITFEKVHWNVAGNVSLADVLTILFLVAFVLSGNVARPPRTVAIVLAFFCVFLLVY